MALFQFVYGKSKLFNRQNSENFYVSAPPNDGGLGKGKNATPFGPCRLVSAFQ